MVFRGRPIRGTTAQVRAHAALGLSALALTGALVATPQLAQADPPLTVDEAKAQIAQLETEAAAIDQVVRPSQAGPGAEHCNPLKLKKADVKSQTTKVQRLRVQAGQVALAQFQNRHLDTAAKLLLSEDTDEFLSQMSTVEKVSENQNSALQDYQEEQAKLTELERSTETETAQLKKEQQTELDKLRVSSDSKIAESKTVLAKLTAAGAAAHRRRRAEGSPRGPGRCRRHHHRKQRFLRLRHSPVVDGSSKGAHGAGFREVAARQALSVRVGRAQRVRLLGAHLGRLVQGRGVAATHVPDPDRCRPVGGRSRSSSPATSSSTTAASPMLSLYAGNGQIVHAPRPGKSVEYASVEPMPFAGARRPGSARHRTEESRSGSLRRGG